MGAISPDGPTNVKTIRRTLQQTGCDRLQDVRISDLRLKRDAEEKADFIEVTDGRNRRVLKDRYGLSGVAR